MKRCILRPATPATFLRHALTKHPTTVIICAAKPDFLQAAVAELQDTPRPPGEAADLLTATLAQIATARHVDAVFLPTVAHLRAYLSVFSPAAAPARILVYGFLDVHRDGSEWSARGIGCSAACLVEAAARAGGEVTLTEPTGWDGEGEARWAAYEEQIPVLGSTGAMREDGSWDVPSASARTILSRWFTLQNHVETR